MTFQQMTKRYTHALTENWMVCRSQRKEVGGPAAADAPEGRAVDPTNNN